LDANNKVLRFLESGYLLEEKVTILTRPYWCEARMTGL